MALGNFDQIKRDGDMTVSRMLAAPLPARKKTEKTYLSIRIDCDLFEQFKAVCAENEITMTDAVMSFVRRTVGLE